MNLPVNGPVAGLPAGHRVTRDAVTPAVGPAAEHLRELALFLSVHLDRAPGVLWPEYDHPVFGDRLGDDRDPAEDEEETYEPGGAAGTGADRPAAAAEPAESSALANVSELASGLADLTGMTTRVAAAGSAPAASPGAPSGHLLVHQIAGAATWHLTGTGDGGRDVSLRYRLRTGEVLYAPDGWARTAEPTADARWTAVVLAPGGGCPG